jgi:hypothetical protein
MENTPKVFAVFSQYVDRLKLEPISETFQRLQKNRDPRSFSMKGGIIKKTISRYCPFKGAQRKNISSFLRLSKSNKLLKSLEIHSSFGAFNGTNF